MVVFLVADLKVGCTKATVEDHRFGAEKISASERRM